MTMGQNLECLPTEIKIIILSFVPDRPSLLSLLLSCKGYNDVFENSALKILLSVLLNEVPAAVLTDALWCWKALSVADKGLDAIFDFLDTYSPRADPQTLLSQLPVAGAEVLDYIEIHQSVLYWASRMHENLSIVRSMTVSEPHQPRKCSHWEVNRLQRSLYRYQLCSLLFQSDRTAGWLSDDEPVTSYEQVQYFFTKLHAVAAEQIRCIYDFLLYYISDDFYAKCEHDVKFAELNVVPSNHEDIPTVHPRLEYILAQGLCYMRSIDQESTSARRCSWIPSCGFEHDFLQQTLKEVDALDLGAYSGDVDDEEGEATCSWDIYRRARTTYDIYAPEQSPHEISHELRYLRSWGYCLWDAETLESLNLLHLPPEISDHAKTWAEAKDQELDDADNRALDSQRARSLILSRGGEGWYDKEGESYIQWTWGVPEDHHLPGEEPPGWTGRTLEDDEKAFPSRPRKSCREVPEYP